MIEIQTTADELVSELLSVSQREPVCILDSCGVGHLGSHLLIAGIRPVETAEIVDDDPARAIRLLDEKLASGKAAIFTLSYELGARLQGTPVSSSGSLNNEPGIFCALFDALIIHDYDLSRTVLIGDEDRCNEIAMALSHHQLDNVHTDKNARQPAVYASSNFSKTEYVAAVERIREYIRRGDTYQTNLTQQLSCKVPPQMGAASIFWKLRRDHPAPFSAFLDRPHSTVISASPERFFRIDRDGMIESSPIKGTRRRGTTPAEDDRLRAELQSSEKDRAENTMIVDLVRNDLGRVCEFGSVAVEKLCDVEEHPTLFHLVSTVRGKLRPKVPFSEILRAVFPCGSITGAPKIRTMQIINELEDRPRGLSMGAIGMHLPESWNLHELGIENVFDVSVAIRTITIANDVATFNVGGGVVIDSEPEKEFEESLLKAKALLCALDARLD